MQLNRAFINKLKLKGLISLGSQFFNWSICLTAVLFSVSLKAEDKNLKKHLLILYNFTETKGAIIDHSNRSSPVDLTLTEPNHIDRQPGFLRLKKNTIIQSKKPATALSEAIKKSGELSVEVWITPESTTLNGPARILTLSKNASERNFTLGQDGNKFDFRIRTDESSINGTPSLASEKRSLTKKLTHVVFTRNIKGDSSIYINGRKNSESKLKGKLSNWDNNYRLALGNEFDAQRAWRGSYHKIAIYSKSLSENDVRNLFNSQAGHHGLSLNQSIQEQTPSLFEKSVATILSRHCLECHDSISSKGDLDLSQKSTAFAGGDEGPPIIPGNADGSLLWESVAEDDMPKKRTPLTKEEKNILKNWINKGAKWDLTEIDPHLYARHAFKNKNWVARLTREEYSETIRWIFGLDLSRDIKKHLPADLRADGFNNTAYNLKVSLKHIQAYHKIADLVVEKLKITSFVRPFEKCNDLEDKCMNKVIQNMGKWILRRPLEKKEVASYLGITTSVSAAGGQYTDAVKALIKAMILSPQFIYRIEQQPSHGETWNLEPYELASRLSYMLWGGPPDRDLLKAAETGKLENRQEMIKQCQRMLKHPRAIQKSLSFIDQWLHLSRLEHLNPDPQKFPNWNKELARDMKNETLAFFKDLIWEQNRPVSDLLNAQFSYLTPELASHYGFDVKHQGMRKVDLKNRPERGGLLTHGSVLTLGGDEASMVTRGLFVMNELLRGVVNDPPADVDTTPVPAKPGLSNRSISENRIKDRACGGCHGKFEPLAFALEKYNGLGAYQEKDHHGNKLREDGMVHIPGAKHPNLFKNSAELMKILASSPRVKKSITSKIVQYAMGRPLISSDARHLEKIYKQSEAGNWTYKSILLALVSSDLVRKISTEKENENITYQP